jgi:hypothetical protein
MIIVDKGGIYADFNDTVCLYPMDYLLTQYQNDYFICTDLEDMSHISNYFMYNSQNNQEFLKYTIDILNTYHKIYNVNTSAQIYDFLKQASYEMLILIKNNKTINIDDMLLTSIDKFDEFLNELSINENNEAYKQIININDIKNVNNKIFFCLVFLENVYKLDLPMKKLIVQLLKYIKKSNNRTKQIPIDVNVTEEHLNDFENITSSIDFKENQYYFIFTGCIARHIMHYTNMPYAITRQGNTSFNLVPFSYLTRFMTYISMMGHFGDGTSYGIDKKYNYDNKLLNIL